jgi:putative transposase
VTRFARVVVPGGPHHVCQRGNRKVKVFRDDSDRLVYLRLMRDACRKYRTFIWSYTLMDNHVHHIAVPEGEDSLGKTIREAHGDYSKYFNTKYGLVGHVWQGRFKSFPMEWDHCRNAIRYVERNPVRAGLVERAEDYLWSSAAVHCGLRDDLLLSGECPLVPEIPNWSEWLRAPENEKTDEMIRRHTRTGRPLGPQAFLRQLEEKTGRKLLPQKRGPRFKSSQTNNNGHQGKDESAETPTLFG